MFHHVFRLAQPGGGYSYYGAAHRLPAFFYLQFSFLGLVIAALAATAILVVLLPALHRKFPSLLLGMTMIMAATVAGYGLIIPEWQVGFLALPSEDALTYRTHRPLAVLLDADPAKQPTVTLGLRIGLSGANFTLVHEARDNRTFYWDERIEFDSLSGMDEQFYKSLHRGLPVAVLELQEQVAFTGEEGGFLWPFHLRRAGYFCSWLLAATIVVWSVTSVLLMALPQHGAASMTVTGALLLATPLLYLSLVPWQPGPTTLLHIGGRIMSVHFGPCFWVCLAGGLWTAGLGATLYLYHVQYPHVFFTDFEVDYDKLDDERRKREAEQKEMEETAARISQPKVDETTEQRTELEQVDIALHSSQALVMDTAL